jgi:hypothetical protein
MQVYPSAESSSKKQGVATYLLGERQTPDSNFLSLKPKENGFAA